jgi:peptidoglycan/LPS O-acetylase OafA/YrhL
MTATLIDAIEQPLPKPPDIQPGPEAPQPRRPPRFPSFDGLRAIAAVTVVGVHVAFVSGFDGRDAGWGIFTARLEIGVSVFFLISGFLLYRPFVVSHLSANSMPRVGAFWMRRALRIVPAYWLVLFIMTTLWHNPPGIGPSGWRSEAVHYLFLQNYFPNQALHGLSAAWSLCVEVTFYLFIPFYAMVVRHGHARRTPSQAMRREFLGLVALVAVSFGWRIVVLSQQSPKGGYWALATTWLPAYLDLFALGMFLAVASAWFHQHDSEWRVFASRAFPYVSWVCALACFWGVSHLGIPYVPLYEETYRDLTRQLLYGGFAFFLLLPAVFGPQGKGKGGIRWFLGTWPMASLGVISYGVYLWHEPWIYRILRTGPYKPFTLNFGAFFAAVLVLSIVSATLSYFIVEKPILRYKNTLSWWRKPASKAVVNGLVRGAPTPPFAAAKAEGTDGTSDADAVAVAPERPMASLLARPDHAVPDELGEAVDSQERQSHPRQRVGRAEACGPDDVGQVPVDPLRDEHVTGQRHEQGDDGSHDHPPRPGDPELGEQRAADDEARQGHHEEARSQTSGQGEHDAETP